MILIIGKKNVIGAYSYFFTCISNADLIKRTFIQEVLKPQNEKIEKDRDFRYAWRYFFYEGYGNIFNYTRFATLNCDFIIPDV